MARLEVRGEQLPIVGSVVYGYPFGRRGEVMFASTKNIISDGGFTDHSFSTSSDLDLRIHSFSFQIYPIPDPT